MPNYQGVWSLSTQFQNRTGWPSPPDPQKALFGGGNSGGAINTIQTIQIDTTGNSTDFGDLSVARASLAACSSLTRGVFGGGQGGAPSYLLQNVLDYVTFSTSGNATDFGYLTLSRVRLAGCSNATRGMFAGGE